MNFEIFFNQQSREFKCYTNSDVSEFNFLINLAKIIVKETNDLEHINDITIYIDEDYEEEFAVLNLDDFFEYLEKVNFTKTDQIYFEFSDEIEDEELDDPNYNGEWEVRQIGNEKFRSKFNRLKVIKVLPDYFYSHNEYIELLQKIALISKKEFYLGQFKGTTTDSDIILEANINDEIFSITFKNLGRFLNSDIFKKLNKVFIENSFERKLVEIHPNGKKSNEDEIYITCINEEMRIKLEKEGFL